MPSHLTIMPNKTNLPISSATPPVPRTTDLSAPADASLVDSRTAAWRLLTALGLAMLGNSGMYVLAVALPEIERDFGVSRADASLPYTLTMIGFGLGGLLCGRWADRYGVARVLALGSFGVASGYVLASFASNIVFFALAHGLLLGMIGIASAFVPLIADTALWWNKRRGLAVGVCASGNYLAGTVWPPIAQWSIEQFGWRPTYLMLGVVCGVGMALLSVRMRQRPPLMTPAAPTAVTGFTHSLERPFGLSIGMAQPQVHIVAYCTDLGFNAARGAEMLSLMLGFGIVSRMASGWISDHIGGLRTLLLGSALQFFALLMFLFFDGLASLYIISAMFGLFQGGIVPSYAIIVREHFPPQHAGALVGKVILGTLIGMALGGWLSGKLFDLTGSYHVAFINGIGWNLLNMSIAAWLFFRSRQGASPLAR